MTKRNNFKLLTSALLVSLALSGCGSDGDDGDNGNPGEPGLIGIAATEATQIVSKVTSASVDDAGVLTINFDLTNANGVAVHSLKNTDIAGVSFGRMGKESEVGSEESEGADDRDIWLSYYVKDKGADADGNALFSGSSYFAGISYNGSVNCSDCLTDNGDGSYTLVTQGTKPDGSEYTVAVDTKDLAYAYDADATNGVYMVIKVRDADLEPIHFDANTYLNAPAFYYWQPSSDTMVERPKAVIADETCETCHRPGHDGNLGNMHHAGKHDTMESCTFCHTDFTQYQQKDEDGSVIGSYDGSIKGIAHNFHMNLEANGKTPFPQTTANCESCHVADSTAQFDAWKMDQDAASCLNCHGEGSEEESHHQEGGCQSCHATGVFGRGAEEAHVTANAAAIASNDIKVEFNTIVVDAAAPSITINMQVMHGDDKLPLSMIDPRDYKYGGKSSAIVINGISNDDFVVNYQKVGVADPSVGEEKSYAVANDDDTITVTVTGDLDAGTGEFKLNEILANDNQIALSSQLHICQDKVKVDGNYAMVPVDCVVVDGELDGQEAPYVTSDTVYFNQDNIKATESPRVQHAAMSNCQDCHDTAIYHRYSNDVDGCANCHNGTRDKKGLGSSNLSYIVHSKHYLGGFFKKTDCQSCHGSEGFKLSAIADDATPVAFGTTDGQRIGTDNEQTFVSPQAAACVSCHQMPYGLNEGVVSHINQNGGAVAINTFTSTDDEGVVTTSYGYGVTADEYEAAGVKETCSVCHTGDQILEAHSNWSSSH
ncbi:multiheme c-type cytochrome [Ferrimonas lipolytica]|uniref:Uncharacterized protein n=1 Tax=Ferrimonas lipolytica TaxID=2724191 RepID=A0A6H1UBR0_9GAMM|nr:cytochrome c3 family protein [Ferrimonas lipolytica]QIZ76020.1 hypothetical protein HER31_03435 [Ferrimonas lipolytica]